jgi:transposase
MTEIVLNRQQRYELQQQLKHTPSASLYRRTLAILELGQGKSVLAVAEALGVTRQSVYNWVETYAKAHDPMALGDAARSGRSSSWTPDLQELLHQLLEEAPADWGLHGTNWTVPLLRQQLASWDGCWLSEDTIRRHLHELGYVWKRTRYVWPPDPDGEKKNGHPPEAQKPATALPRAVRG